MTPSVQHRLGAVVDAVVCRRGLNAPVILFRMIGVIALVEEAWSVPYGENLDTTISLFN